MFPSSLASFTAHATAPTMDTLPAWVPVALAAVAVLAIALIVVAVRNRRKSERDTLDGALGDARQAVRDASQASAQATPSDAPQGRGRHAK